MRLLTSLYGTPVLQEEEVTQLTLALQHDHLLHLHPTTKEECIRIAKGEGRSKSCECMLHTMDPPCSSLLQGIMANVSEPDGQLYSRNLTNMDVLKYIMDLRTFRYSRRQRAPLHLSQQGARLSMWWKMKVEV